MLYQVDSSCMLRSYGHGICIPSSGRRAQPDDRYVYGNRSPKWSKAWIYHDILVACWFSIYINLGLTLTICIFFQCLFSYLGIWWGQVSSQPDFEIGMGQKHTIRHVCGDVHPISYPAKKIWGEQKGNKRLLIPRYGCWAFDEVFWLTITRFNWSAKTKNLGGVNQQY